MMIHAEPARPGDRGQENLSHDGMRARGQGDIITCQTHDGAKVIPDGFQKVWATSGFRHLAVYC